MHIDGVEIVCGAASAVFKWISRENSSQDGHVGLLLASMTAEGVESWKRSRIAGITHVRAAGAVGIIEEC